MRFLFLLLFLAGCQMSSILSPKPTGDDEKDIYIQEWLSSVNITYCTKVLDLEYGIDGYVCAETLTDKQYYVPMDKWKADQLEPLFLRVSKHQLREKLDKDDSFEDFLCKQYKCEGADIKSMPELQPYIHE